MMHAFIFIFHLHNINAKCVYTCVSSHQGIFSASLCSLAGRYDNPTPTRFLVPTDCLKIPAQVDSCTPVSGWEHVLQKGSHDLNNFATCTQLWFSIFTEISTVSVVINVLSSDFCPKAQNFYGFETFFEVQTKIAYT